MPRGSSRIRTAAGALNGINAKVRERLEDLNLSQYQLAARIATATDGSWNPTEDEIYKLQRGTRIVSDLELRVLARVLACSVPELLSDDPPQMPPDELAKLAKRSRFSQSD